MKKDKYDIEWAYVTNFKFMLFGRIIKIVITKPKDKMTMVFGWKDRGIK